MSSDSKTPTKISIKTFGCQMNMYDSELAQGMLEKSGYTLIPDRIAKTKFGEYETDADVVLMNTCSVREHAEDRVYGRLGMLGEVKKKKPDLVVGLMGCMVEEHREKLFKRFPYLDLMVGTRNISDLVPIIEEVKKTRRQVAKIKQEGLSIEYSDQIKREGKYHAWLPIMTGCNKVCTFCIVPITRGSEVSMPARDVYREASRLVDDGVKWITLLGQNVNSYRGGEGGKEVTFPELLNSLCEIEGLQGISFTTSHPHDATKDLYEVIRNNPKISRRFHLPLQSASNYILKRMKRLHTFEEYRDKINLMREMIPDVSITTDIIAGFSGERPEDHEATCQALRDIRYDGAYIYKYSLRPGTPASNLADDVPIIIKEQRNAELLDIQRKITEENNRKLLGQTFEVFVENISTKTDSQVLGRSHAEKKIVFPGGPELLGTSQKIKILDLKSDTFIGQPVS